MRVPIRTSVRVDNRLLGQDLRQAPILDGFRQMLGTDRITPFQIRDTAGDAQHPVVAPRREMQGLGGAAEQAGAHRIQGAKLRQQFALKLCVC